MSFAGESPARFFFAALPDATARDRTAAAARALSLEPEARRVREENYHVTLAFVGEIPASQVALLLDAGRALCEAKFNLQFDAYEYWPTAEVVVAAAGAVPAALERLWQDLHRELARHQWALEPKRLRPHVTLARKVSQAPVLQAMSAFDWPVSEFSLMRSDSGGAQPAYTVVGTWSLLDSAAET